MSGLPMKTQRVFCTFRLDGHLYGVDVLDVKEVATATTATPISHAPDEVMGLVNIRGQIYLALDLRRLLGLPAARLTAESRLVLFKPFIGNAFGVVVDAISEIHTVMSDCMEPFFTSEHEPLGSTIRRIDLISAVCKLSEELLVVLNPRRFLPAVEHDVFELREPIVLNQE